MVDKVDDGVYKSQPSGEELIEQGNLANNGRSCVFKSSLNSVQYRQYNFPDVRSSTTTGEHANASRIHPA
jgi:hypothetical protein